MQTQAEDKGRNAHPSVLEQHKDPVLVPGGWPSIYIYFFAFPWVSYGKAQRKPIPKYEVHVWPLHQTKFFLLLLLFFLVFNHTSSVINKAISIKSEVHCYWVQPTKQMCTIRLHNSDVSEWTVCNILYKSACRFTNGLDRTSGTNGVSVVSFTSVFYFLTEHKVKMTEHKNMEEWINN